MLETSIERAMLLKMGIDGKTIEKLYVIYNNIKIIEKPILLDPINGQRSQQQHSFFIKFNDQII